MRKNFSDYLSLFAIEQLIVEDIKVCGHSTGWTGDYETFKILRDKLQNQNVHYNYLGTWSNN